MKDAIRLGNRLIICMKERSFMMFPAKQRKNFRYQTFLPILNRPAAANLTMTGCDAGVGSCDRRLLFFMRYAMISRIRDCYFYGFRLSHETSFVELSGVDHRKNIRLIRRGSFMNAEDVRPVLITMPVMESVPSVPPITVRTERTK